MRGQRRRVGWWLSIALAVCFLPASIASGYFFDERREMSLSGFAYSRGVMALSHDNIGTHKGYYQIKTEGKLSLFKSYKGEFSDGEQKRDFIYVKDVLEIMVWFWKNPKIRGIFNLGTGKAETWNHLGRCIFAALGKEPRIEYIDMPSDIRDQYQYWTQADLTKLRASGVQFNFSSLKDGIADYIRHIEMNQSYLTGRTTSIQSSGR